MSRIMVETDWEAFVNDYNLDFMAQRNFSSWLLKNKTNKINNVKIEDFEIYWEEYQELNY